MCTALTHGGASHSTCTQRHACLQLLARCHNGSIWASYWLHPKFKAAMPLPPSKHVWVCAVRRASFMPTFVLTGTGPGFPTIATSFGPYGGFALGAG